MSDPVSNVEIEDVLSSIRRLVAGDRETQDVSEVAPESDLPPEAEENPLDSEEALVLTPALRVADDTDTEEDASDPISEREAEPWEFETSVGETDPEDATPSVPEHSDASIALDSQAAVEPEPADARDLETGVAVDAEEVRPDETVDAGAPEQEDAALPTFSRSTVTRSESTEPEAEPESPVGGADVTAPYAAASPEPQFSGSARRAGFHFGTLPEEVPSDRPGPVSFPEPARAPDPEDAVTGGDPEPAFSPFDAAVKMALEGDDPVPAMPPEDSLSPIAKEPCDEEFSRSYLSEPEPIRGTTDFGGVEAQKPSAPVRDWDSDDNIADDPDNLFADGRVDLDDETLRELVVEIVHRELRGALGERITRNVRKLVRREIHRALAARDFD